MAEPLPLTDEICPIEDFSRYGTFILFKEIRRIINQRHQLDYRLLAMLRELDKRDSLDGRPFSLPAWLAGAFGMGYGAAREKVRTARALGYLPLIDAAFQEGRLSYSKVRALTRVARPDNEEQLLRYAADISADGLEQLVQRYKQRERLDDVQEMIRQRSLTYAWDEDGSLVVKARLTPEQGAIWLKAMEVAEEALDPEEAFEIRQADAMTHALEESLIGASGGEKRAPQSGDRYQVVVHVPAETLCASSEPLTRHVDDLAPGLMEDGPSLHPETVKRLSCDAAIVPIIKSFKDEVLNVGRKTRTIPSAIRRALKARDGHCQYPGCGHSRYLDGHHIVHWANGGETKLDNLLLLCRKHHRHVHEFAVQVARTDEGFTFNRPI